MPSTGESSTLFKISWEVEGGENRKANAKLFLSTSNIPKATCKTFWKQYTVITWKNQASYNSKLC